MYKKVLIVVAAALSLVGSVAEATPSYMPYGPQTDVALSTITNGGWTECYSAPMATFIGNGAENVLSQCTDQYIMMAGEVTGSNTFLAVAATTLIGATTDTGQTSNFNVSNGSEWWFSDNWSWGFTAIGDDVDNGQCNVANGPISMCLHTVNGAGGYRINNIEGLNDSTDYSKVFFEATGAAVPEPGSIALVALGLLAFAVASRKAKQKG